MANIIIPTVKSKNNYQFSIDLENTTYVFELYYNTRAGYWTLNLYDDAETLLIAGVALLLKVNLLDKYTNPALPQGILHLINLKEENVEATFDSLGEDVLLMYEEA